MPARNRTMRARISRRRSCAVVFAQGAMAGLANLDADSGRKPGGQAEPRSKDAKNQRIAAPDQFDAAAHAHAEHLEALHLLIVRFNAPHDGANARRQLVQTRHRLGGMVNDCHSESKIGLPTAMSNPPRGWVDVFSACFFSSSGRGCLNISLCRGRFTSIITPRHRWIRRCGT